MKQKLASELTSLAHGILQMKDKNDIQLLKNKAQQVYERLLLLEFIDTYVETTPHATETKEALTHKIELAVEMKEAKVLEKITAIEELKEEVKEEVKEEEKEAKEELVKEEVIKTKKLSDTISKNISEKTSQITLKEELMGTVAADVANDIFENAKKIVPNNTGESFLEGV